MIILSQKMENHLTKFFLADRSRSCGARNVSRGTWRPAIKNGITALVGSTDLNSATGRYALKSLMRVTIDLPDEAYRHLLTMARQAHITVAEMVAIGAFNLVALWMVEKNITIPMDADDGLATSK